LRVIIPMLEYGHTIKMFPTEGRSNLNLRSYGGRRVSLPLQFHFKVIT
jgi:hypothetical protein